MEKAKKYLRQVCGNMQEPNAEDIIMYCSPIITANLRVSKEHGDDAEFENTEIAKIARNAFIMGYLCGGNDSY